MASAYILVVDDEPDIRTLLQEILQDEGYEVATAESGEEARRLRRVRRPDLVLLDIWMPGIDGISLLKEWKEEEEDGSTPIIMMSGHGTVETAVEATRLGAYDFIEKPLSLAKLLVTVQRALEAYNLYRENAGLKRQAQPVTEPVGKSEAMRRLINQVRRIAQHDTAVLISGEPGSGKSLFAHYLHDSSPRRRGPFVDVGVASLLGDNPAVELFGGEEEGHVQYGLLEQASGGTLFLDDIGDMDVATQARLLGALETGRYQRIGGSEPVKTDVRIVAATRYDLEQRIAEGRFRNDLYYQLNVVPLTVVPLRQHAEDIPELLNFYVDYFVSQDNLPYRDFSVSAQNRLRHYAWPGNVRELKNLVQRLLIVGHSSQVDADEVDAALGSAKHASSPAVGVAFDLPLRQAREQFERTYFEHLLREYGGNVNQTAQHAGVERTHLYRKLRTLGIDPKQVE
ncbi:sigma-54-dependent transcriptional regulator [Thiohalomonas denitrificans]|uniref:DNA-binding transcriptional response regulator, NtrC family, contains REC, AAA-type ATPase, and a Fis-type DNA-binding domains n=1 Tax=Thiohalomonas denitrificans TaxID=415747 RepID=A0A1G5QRU4_9GAMM|nr:sigma-54 dependent transcriptional regulator [Thiohalomonas denitrificans]SCZ64472.1 DNA-binding transcriptional response regulator, NtrC family, contains REC, AAA-type ATPase, and a Fis-type DNA-binding domains [Thiohalomonas denitrificans]